MSLVVGAEGDVVTRGEGAIGASSGDDEDERLFADLYPALRRFAGVVRPPHVEADDLVQEAVARVLTRHRLTELDEPGAYLRRTILRLASNERRSWFRGRRAYRRMRPVDAAEDARPSDLDELLRLTPVERAVLYLSAVEGWAFGEVAAALGCSEEAARTRASRARRRLRAELGGDAT